MAKPLTGWGATPEEWGTFDVLLGLTADLLPVVMNPSAVISPSSRMKEKGKTPSIYDKHGQVVGIVDWTKRVSTELDIERWSKRSDYGICIQTRNIRAIDIDITDPDMVRAVRLVIAEHIGDLPLRYRANSSKCLIAFRMEGEFAKRILRVAPKTDGQPAQLIEFLANGQQFIAAGTHASGARIEWNWMGFEEFPFITEAQFEKLWHALEQLFAMQPGTKGSLRQRGESFVSPDPVAAQLYDRGLALDIGNDGQLFVECPWKGNHSSDSGVTETAYFPRGTNGYELGHFKCMHAGCADKDDTDFEEALGLRDDMFKAVVIAPETNEKGEVLLEPPPFDRNKQGVIKNTLHNLSLVLPRADICGREIKYDVYRDEDMIRFPGCRWRPLTDGDVVKLRIHLEKRIGFMAIGRELMRDALAAHGEDHRFDSAIEWLQELEEWDGVPRIDTFMHKYFSADDGPYARAVGRYLWSALAARTLTPGSKADMAVILRGEQGVIKSTAIAALSPTDDQFAELNLGDGEDKLARLMRGKSVIELGELRGFYSKEFEAIKAWLVRRFDHWVPKYKERSVTFYRRCVFIGTTNHKEFLIDETGNRRFLPIEVQRADIKAIKRDLRQLWAEARDLYLAEGICWEEAEELARAEHHKFTVHDSWAEDIETWLEQADIDGVKNGDKPYLRVSDVMRSCLQIDARSATNVSEKRTGKVLNGLGWKSTRMYIAGKQMRVFVKR